MKSTLNKLPHRPIYVLRCCLGSVGSKSDTFLNPHPASSQAIKFNGTFAWVSGDAPPAWRAVVFNGMVCVLQA